MASHVLDPDQLRPTGAVMLAAGVLLPLLPGHPGVPCPLRTLTGVPCPLCGMTTSVTATLRLRPGDAVAANPGGVVLVAAAVILLVVRRLPAVALPSWLVPVSLGLLWVWELARFSVL